MPAPSPSRCALVAILSLVLLSAHFGHAQPPEEAVPGEPLTFPEPNEPPVAPASEEGQRALGSFRVIEELEGELVAAEPLLANPVAMWVDSQGRIYVCETFRQDKAVADNRAHMDWLDEDLAAQSVEDRVAFYRRHFGEGGYENLALDDDRIRLLTDTDADGIYDEATVFADHFNHPMAGTGAGVLEYRGDVYYTCIPDLWRLRDTNGDGQSEERDSLHYGFGVRVAFRGHDMHGLTIGPDGRLYFSIGDRGLHVETEDGTLHNVESGSVLRCELDGSNLEIFATGLRNPQELAFDDYGHLFTGDNNSDGGDKARWVYVVEGGDTGWRMAYQYLDDRGPWNNEKLWHPQHEGQAAYVVPPIANFASGPSGLAYYPGTGFDDSWQGTFLLCDFRGAPVDSGIRSIKVEPQGAFFEVADQGEPIWQVLATDVNFGPDGAIYVCDWVHGWSGEGKGRIYRFADPAHAQDPLVLETQELLAGNWDALETERLVQLLAHADRRVRQESQFTLVRRGEVNALAAALAEAESPLARLHAIWGLGQLYRISDFETFSQSRDALHAALSDADPHVRVQAVSLLGEWPKLSDPEIFLTMLSDPAEHSEVVYQAALALGRIGNADYIEPLLARLAENNNADPILRHGCIMGLAGVKDLAALEAAEAESSAAKLGLVVALRRRESPGVAKYLADADVLVALEAARAIYDTPIPTALPELAATLDSPTENEPLLWRAIYASYRLGCEEDAQRLARFALREESPLPLRTRAVELLSAWAEPPSRDPLLGMWRPIEPRDPALAREALVFVLPQISESSLDIQSRIALAAGRLGIAESAPLVRELLTRQEVPGTEKAELLIVLAELEPSDMQQTLEVSLASESPQLRAAARRVWAESNSAGATPILAAALAEGTVWEQQQALGVLARVPGDAADAMLVELLGKATATQLRPELTLDLLFAASERQSTAVAQALAAYEEQRVEADPLSPYLETLYGGDVARGREVFFSHTSASCLRCHSVSGEGGDVGPELTRVATERDRHSLLQSIALPSAEIVRGYESVNLDLVDGRVMTGILKAETEEQLELVSNTGAPFTVLVEDIDYREPGRSAMPDNLIQDLTLWELRDLIEYLSTLN